MFYYFKKWLTKKETIELFEEIKIFKNKQPKIIGNPKVYGTEIDLTNEKMSFNVKELIEKKCETIYNRKFSCINYWISISEPGQIVISHNHIDEESFPSISTILYINAEINCGKLNLESFNKELTVETGDLVVFPSTCFHSVDKNMSKEPRTCISFDLIEI